MNNYFTEARTKTPECEAVESFSKDFFLANKFSLFRKGLPFIISHFFEASQTTDIIDKLRNNFGDKSLKVRFHSTALDYAHNRKYERMLLKDYLTEVQNEENENQPYAANNFIDENILSLLNIDSPLNEFSGQLRSPKIWIGAKGTSTPLHKDSTDNFSIQLYGEKCWSVYSIRDTEYLYFEKSSYGDYLTPQAEFEVSPIDLENISYEKFPFFKQAKKIDILVKQGDLFYLPYGWGHSVRNLTSSIMINFWFELGNYKPLIISE